MNKSAQSSPANNNNNCGSANKVCVVCGDKSYGLNFNAVTCESCKAFFRRNALGKTLACPFAGQCKISVITRRFCQKCRLDKCFSVGMKKEHIMSEEEKIRKRNKIEMNRAKKNTVPQQQLLSPESVHSNVEEPPVKVKREQMAFAVDGSSCSTSSSPEDFSLSNGSAFQSPSSSTAATEPMLADMLFTMTAAATPPAVEPVNVVPKVEPAVMPSLNSSPSEIVNSIIQAPVPGLVINHLMKTPQDGIAVMERILNSPKDAIQLIGHFIGSPGDALKIISKIMNSPFDALTIFTKFMSSPTDSIEIITKIISSPNDVLQFLQQLMRSPEDGLQIMTKFMNAPAEALRMINSMMNQAKADSTTDENCAESSGTTELINITGLDVDSIADNEAQLKVILDRVGEHLNGQSGSHSPANLPSSSTESEPIESAVRGETGAAAADALLQPDAEQGDTVAEMAAATDAIVGSDLFKELVPMTANFIIDEIIKDSLKNSCVVSPSSAPMDTILCEAIKLEYEGQMTVRTGSSSKELNENEQAKLSELIVANKALYAPVDEDISSLIADEYRLNVSGDGMMGSRVSGDSDMEPAIRTRAVCVDSVIIIIAVID